MDKKYPSRKPSRFICRELLYDYLSESLDPKRRKDVEDCLKVDATIKAEFEALKQAMQYCEILSETQVTPEFVGEILQDRTWRARLVENLNWYRWPEFLRWGTEALVVSVIVAAIAVSIPWGKVMEMIPKQSVKEITLVEIEEPSSEDMAATIAEEELAEEERRRVALDELSADSKEEKEVASTAGKPPLQLPGEPKSGSMASSDSDSAMVVTKSNVTDDNKVSKKFEPDKEEASEGQKASTESAEAEKKGVPKGEVYRVFMSMSALDEVTPGIAEAIRNVGGSKAGQVELGWRRENGSYFHFSLLESRYDELVQALKNFGPVRIQKDPHWRVMPDGKIRFILWVEDEEIKNK